MKSRSRHKSRDRFAAIASAGERTFQATSDRIARRLSQGAFKLSGQVTLVAQGHVQLFVGDARSAGLSLAGLGRHCRGEQGAGRDEKQELQHNCTRVCKCADRNNSRAPPIISERGRAAAAPNCGFPGELARNERMAAMVLSHSLP